MADDELTKLHALLSYWIEHNREHIAELQEWAERAEGLRAGKDIGPAIHHAVTQMQEANEALARALHILEGGDK